jgi:hypothetical protein
MLADFHYKFATEAVRAKPHMKLDVISNITNGDLRHPLPSDFQAHISSRVPTKLG